MGSFAVAYSLRGAGFYQLLEESGLEPFRQIGVDTVLAAVSPVHLRAMRQRLKHATVQELQTIEVSGKAFILVIVRSNAPCPLVAARPLENERCSIQRAEATHGVQQVPTVD